MNIMVSIEYISVFCGIISTSNVIETMSITIKYICITISFGRFSMDMPYVLAAMVTLVLVVAMCFHNDDDGGGAFA